jgi:hypothetical protein
MLVVEVMHHDLTTTTITPTIMCSHYRLGFWLSF